MALKKHNGKYLVSDIKEITEVELFNFLFEITGDLQELILFEKSDVKSCKEVLDNLYDKSSFERTTILKIFNISYDEQLEILRECLSTKKVLDIFEGNNLCISPYFNRT